MDSFLLTISDGRGCWLQVECAASTPLSSLQSLLAPALHLEQSDWFFEDCQQHHFYGTAKSCEDAKTPLSHLNLKEGDVFRLIHNDERGYIYTVKVKKRMQKQVDFPRIVRTHGSSIPWPSAITPPTWEKQRITQALAVYSQDLVDLERTYLCATANLYGICLLSRVQGLMENYGRFVEQQMFYRIAEILRHDETLECFIIGGDDLSSIPVKSTPTSNRFAINQDIILLDEDPSDLIANLFFQHLKHQDYYIPSNEQELLKWANPLYQAPSPLLKILQKVLRESQGLSPAESAQFLKHLAFLARSGAKPEQTLFPLFQEWKLSFHDEEELSLFSTLCVQWACSIPQWCENGFPIAMTDEPPKKKKKAKTRKAPATKEAEELSEFDKFRLEKEAGKHKC